MGENRFHPAVLPLLILTAFAVVFFFSPAAHAYVLPAFDFGDLEHFWTTSCPEDDEHGLIERFVLCTRITVTNAFLYFIYYVYPAFQETIYAAITFCVILFGVKAVSGNMENVGRESFMLALKIGFVVYFTANLDFVFDTMINLMDSLLNMVTEFAKIGPSSPLDTLRCRDDSLGPLNFVLSSFGLSEWPFWGRIDCLLNGIIGLNHDPSTGDYQVRFSQGVLAFFIYCIASGLWGFIIFLMGISICSTLILCALRAVQIYLMCFIMLAILTIMGVIFIPLILFKNETVNGMFKKWVTSGIGYMLQPVLMFAFMSVLMTAFDVVMFSSKHSVFYALAGDASQEADFNLHNYLQTNDVYTVDQNSFDYFLDPGVFNTQEPCADKGIAKDQGILGNAFCLDAAGANTASESLRRGIDFKAIDWKKLGEVRNPPFDAHMPDPYVNVQYSVASAMIMAALAIYVFNTFMTYLPNIVGTITGGADRLKGTRQLANEGFNLPGEGVASSFIGRAGSGIEAKLGFRG